jgi:hypothetical protein
MSNSLGVITEQYRRKVSIVVQEKDIVIEPIKSKSFFEKNIKNILYISLSLFFILFILFLGFYFIPLNLLYNFNNYEGIIDLFRAMGNWISNNFLFIFITWLLPIPFGVFIPLKYTELLLQLASIVFSIIMYGSFLIPGQGDRFINYLRTTPEASYMWYDYLTIVLGTFITQPSYFWLILFGPIVCITFGNYSPKKNWGLYVLLSALSIFFIVQISNVFINDQDEFFILGYYSDSIFATSLQSGMIVVWIRCFHIVCRDCYNTFTKYKRVDYRILSIVWLFVGTSLVEIWVSTAWTFHLAYSSFMKLEKEPGFSTPRQVFNKILLYIKK